jgi:hypothetical protein
MPREHGLCLNEQIKKNKQELQLFGKQLCDTAVAEH